MEIINLFGLKSGIKYKNIEHLAFHNSIVYATGIRSAFSEFRFKYWGQKLILQCNPTAYATYPQYSQITLKVNNKIFATYKIENTNFITINLPNGYKDVVIYEGLLSKPSTILGTFLTTIRLDINKFFHYPIVPIPEKLVFLGDSITVGANADIPSLQGYSTLFREIDKKEVAVLGYGYGKIYDFMETQGKIDAVITQLTSLFSGVTTKKLIISLGTNDFGLDSRASTTIAAWYEHFLDDVYTAFNDIQIFCISPIIRSSDGALLDDYRTAIADACTERSTYCTHIVGKTILTTVDLSDGVHPTTSGHLKYYEAIQPTIL